MLIQTRSSGQVPFHLDKVGSDKMIRYRTHDPKFLRLILIVCALWYCPVSSLQALQQFKMFPWS